MAIVEEVEHLFNPTKTLADFPSKVEAVFPIKRIPISNYHITSAGIPFNADTGRRVAVNKIAAVDRFDYLYKNQAGRDVGDACRLRDIMVLSFFAGHYDKNAKLITVIHNDRNQSNNQIHNLVPIFTLKQLQSYFVYRLNIITGEHFRVAVSKYPKEFTLDHYLVGDAGTIFGLDKLYFLKPSTTRYASYCFSPTFHQANHGSNTRIIAGHTVVANTFIGEIPPTYEIHHKDGHPRNNRASNLAILSQDDHQKLHQYRFQSTDNQAKQTCTLCLEEDEVEWCPCKRAYCKEHIVNHQQQCWYWSHDSDPEYNVFFPLMWDKSQVPGFKINKKGDIQGTQGFVRSTSMSTTGYPVVCLSSNTKTLPVHQFMGYTFFPTEFDAIENGVMHHIDSNPLLNHIRNLRPTTIQQNQLHASGISVVVVHKSTEASTTYHSIDSCADAFRNIYPKLKQELYGAEKTVEKKSHIFHRDQKRMKTFDKFYFD